MDGLQILALVIALVATVVGVTVFALGVRAIVRTLRRGGPAPDRTTHRGRRTWLVVKEVLGHGRFQHRPMVRVAHWVVMVSFPVLFLTLITGYGQIVEPTFALPLIGHWAPFEWLVEVFAWLGLLGIVALALVRQREHPRRGVRAGTRVSGARREQDLPAADGAAGPGGPEGGRSSRFFGSNRGQAYFVEAIIAAVIVCVLLLRGLEYALAAAPPVHDGSGPLVLEDTAGLLWHFPLTAWFGQWFVGLGPVGVERAVVVVALLKILTSMLWMVVVGTRPAMGVSWHRFLAVVNVWARRETDGSPALGPLPPVRAGGTPVDFAALEDLPDDATLGVGRIEDFSWKGLLDFSTCTECGRCQEQCPAWNTGKPLSPKLVVLALRDHAHATAPYLKVAANASTEPSGHTATTGHVPLPGAGGAPAAGSAQDAHADLDVLSLVGDVVDPEALWDCTTCGACVQQCPVDIEHVDHIVDLRRNQVLMESAFPDELGPMFAKLEKQANPWGLPARQRLAWAKDLPFPVPVVGVDVEDATGVEYLFWVGCAGAYEDRAKRTTRAVAELLHTAGVSFAVLGDGEQCTGDPARRAGNEMLFQMLAQANVEVLTEVKAQRIVVTCAHCFNTIAREYPQLGGQFEVVHHTELLERLLADGRLTVVEPVREPGAVAAEEAPHAAQTVTYHDPCYLGRHNQVYTPPRELLAAVPGLALAEMPRSHERSFCCGGGGARVWMEETTGTRISTDRAAEAIGTGARTVATGCPFCTIMLTDGVAANGAGTGEDAVEVVDVAQLLLPAVRRADDDA